jgi:hypothetical protein
MKLIISLLIVVYVQSHDVTAPLHPQACVDIDTSNIDFNFGLVIRDSNSPTECYESCRLSHQTLSYPWYFTLSVFGELLDGKFACSCYTDPFVVNKINTNCVGSYGIYPISEFVWKVTRCTMQTITFDDLESTLIPNNYKHLSWNDISIIAGMANMGDHASMSSINPFTVFSVYATSWKGNDTVMFTAYSDGVQVAVQTFPITDIAPTLIIFPNTFSSITGITFNHSILDNLTICI